MHKLITTFTILNSLLLCILVLGMDKISIDTLLPEILSNHILPYVTADQKNRLNAVLVCKAWRKYITQYAINGYKLLSGEEKFIQLCLAKNKNQTSRIQELTASEARMHIDFIPAYYLYLLKELSNQPLRENKGDPVTIGAVSHPTIKQLRILPLSEDDSETWYCLDGFSKSNDTLKIHHYRESIHCTDPLMKGGTFYISPGKQIISGVALDPDNIKTVYSKVILKFGLATTLEVKTLKYDPIIFNFNPQLKIYNENLGFMWSIVIRKDFINQFQVLFNFDFPI